MSIMDIFKDKDGNKEIERINRELTNHNGKINELHKNLQQTVNAVSKEQQLMKVMNGEMKKVQDGIRKSLTESENAYKLAQESWNNQMRFFKTSFNEIQKREYNLYVAHRDLANSWGVWARTLESRNEEIRNKSGYHDITIPVVKLRVKIMKSPIKLFFAIRNAITYIGDIFKASKVKIQKIEQETKALSDSFVSLFKSVGGVVQPRKRTTTSTTLAESKTAQQRMVEEKPAKKKAPKKAAPKKRAPIKTAQQKAVARKVVARKRASSRRGGGLKMSGNSDYEEIGYDDENYDEKKFYRGNDKDGVVIR